MRKKPNPPAYLEKVLEFPVFSYVVKAYVGEEHNKIYKAIYKEDCDETDIYASHRRISIWESHLILPVNIDTNHLTHEVTHAVHWFLVNRNGLEETELFAYHNGYITGELSKFILAERQKYNWKIDYSTKPKAKKK